MPVVVADHPAHRAVALWAMILLALAAPGCGGEDDDELSHDEREVRNAGITWWRQLDVALIANTAALDYGAGGLTPPSSRPDPGPFGAVPSGPVRGALQPAHAYGINCPDVTPAVTGDLMRVYVVYGDLGCQSDLSGQRQTGYVQLDVTLPTKTGTLVAANLATGDYRVNGTIGATYQDTMVTIDARSLMVSSPEGSVTITSCLGIFWSMGGSRELLSDDSWRILGTSTVNTLSLESGAIYHLEVPEDDPILANPRCAWPVSGRVDIQRQEPPLAATLDFGDGACDSEAILTVAGRTRIVDLENVSD
ncbi:MAG TPA: hypothetical protein VF720_13300 [Candidatus Eisenbacteria bacterium]